MDLETNTSSNLNPGALTKSSNFKIFVKLPLESDVRFAAFRDTPLIEADYTKVVNG